MDKSNFYVRKMTGDSVFMLQLKGVEEKMNHFIRWYVWKRKMAGLQNMAKFRHSPCFVWNCGILNYFLGHNLFYQFFFSFFETERGTVRCYVMP